MLSLCVGGFQVLCVSKEVWSKFFNWYMLAGLRGWRRRMFETRYWCMDKG